MFTLEADTTIATISELRTKAKDALEASRTRPVVILIDGKPAGAVVSMEMLELVQEARENRQLARIGAARLKRVETGEDALMDHEEFWAEAEARLAQPARA